MFYCDPGDRYRLLSCGLQLLLSLLLAGYVSFVNLGASSITFYDETIEVQPIQEAALFDNWLTPTLGGAPYLKKPPLQIWLGACILKLFGQSNFTLRFVNATAGIGTALVVFFFARSLFPLPLVGLISVLSLFGARCFVSFHGVRMAVQESLLVFLCSLAIAVAWYCFHGERSRFWAIICGVAVGLAVLAKVALGYIPLVVFGVWILLSGNLGFAWKDKRREVLLLGFLALLVPALFYIPHFIFTERYFYAFVVHELFERATRVFGKQTSILFYWKVLISNESSVPRYLLISSVAFGFWRVFRYRDHATLYVLCWALLAPLIYSFPKTRFPWYIASAIPGIALLSAILVSSLLRIALSELNAWSQGRSYQKIKMIPASLALFLSLAGLGQRYLLVVQGVWAETDRILFDNVQEEFSILKKQGVDIGPLVFLRGDLTLPESVYRNMFGAKNFVEVRGFSGLSKELTRYSNPLLVVSVRHLKKALKLGSIAAYALAEPTAPNSPQFLFIAFGPGQKPASLLPAQKLISLDNETLKPLYGFGARAYFDHRVARPVLCGQGALAIKGDKVMRALGSQISISARALKEDVRLSAYLNQKLLGEVNVSSSAFGPLDFSIPPDTLQIGQNALILEVSPARSLTYSQLGACGLAVQSVTVSL